MLNDWLRHLEKRIVDHQLLGRGESVLVSVSGGIDSMVLLHTLHRLSAANGWKLRIAHFNHRLRGRSSDADERLVRKTAKELGLRISVGAGDVRNLAQKQKISVEMAARTLRHSFLAKTARKFKINKIALGHHADDQVELFFLRLQRGSGTLAGMAEQGPSPIDKDILLVRPLMKEPREVLMWVAGEMNVPFREDESNADCDFQRNRIRHEVIPALKRQSPPIFGTVLRSMEIVGSEADFVRESARQWFQRRSIPFEDLHIAVQRRVLREQMERLKLPFDFDVIEQLRRLSDHPVFIPSGVQVFRKEDGTVSLRLKEESKFSGEALSIELKQSGSCLFGSLRFRWSIAPVHEGSGEACREGRERFDADKLGGRLTLRFWQPGDRMQPIGFSHNVKLQDLFVNAKVPVSERRRKVVATAENGEIFWVEGLRISDRFKLSAATRRQLKWHWQTT